MKVAILAGGRGSRLAEETATKPKPMIEIGGRPVLWHVMMHYAYHGFSEFVIALGYRGDYIKDHLPPCCARDGNASIVRRNGRVIIGDDPCWTIDLVETGEQTMTGGRIKRLAPHLGNSTFMLTWGDGLSTVDLDALLAFHRAHGKLATVTAVRPRSRFGRIEINGDRVIAFTEKPPLTDTWVNGAFFVLEPGVFDYIDGDDTQWEAAPMERLSAEGQLMAYRHPGFWQCMDTPSDKLLLEELWQGHDAPWNLRQRE